MINLTAPHPPDIRHPINLMAGDFYANKDRYYTWLREHAPVYKGKFSLLNIFFISRYEDCLSLLKDPRFVRNRSHAVGGGRFPFPTPKLLNLLGNNMILADGAEHHRLRNLVHQGFTPRALSRLEGRIETLCDELLERMPTHKTVDLIQTYALPIPVTVISEMVGVSAEEMPIMRNSIRAVTEGFSGFSLLRTFMRDLPVAVRFVRELITRKRKHPQDDILSALIQAEDQGEKMTEDELVSLVFLLILAGYETTVHLIANSIVTLLTHPDQLRRLQRHPELMAPAIEEVLRFCGPVESTKLHYAKEDVVIRGVSIPKGATVLPLLAAANRDPAAFEHAGDFDIARSPNKHLGFGQGIHYCLGAPLARLETRIALSRLFERFPDVGLTVSASALKRQYMPLWHRYADLPVQLRL